LTQIEESIRARLTADKLEALELQNEVANNRAEIIDCMSAIQKIKDEGLKFENFENEMRHNFSDSLSNFLTTSDKDELFERS
jgi:hypothetical protein